MKRLKLFILASGLLLVLNWQMCSQQPSVRQIEEDKFVQIYCDVVCYSELIPPEKRIALVDSVLAHYQVSRQEFDFTIDAYSKEKNKWKKIFEKIETELEARSNLAEPEKSPANKDIQPDGDEIE